MNEAAPNVLRVLNGRLAGTEKPLPARGTLSIGHQYWQNIVIRTPETKGVAVDLTLDENGAAQIMVLSGEATLLGSTLSAGQTALVPAYVPFSIGGVAMAWGDPASVRWTEAGELAGSTPALPTAPPTAREQALAVAENAGARIGDMLSGWRLAVLVGLVLLLIGVMAAGPVIDALGLRGDAATRVRHALGQAGLPLLQVANDPAMGGVIVTGVVRNAAERARAQAVLRDAYIPGTISVQTSDGLAQASVEVARIQGLPATARAVGRSTVELHTVALEPGQRDKLTRTVRADVPGITQLIVREDLQSIEDSAIKSVQDITRKVSTVVAGDPAYIQTADGARYFAGAIMPSGHRLVAIEGQTILLERNGHMIRLAF